MILDKLLQFSDAQAVTASAKSTSGIDLGAVVRDIGVGQNLFIVLSLAVAMTDAGSDSTVTVNLESDADSAFGSPTVVQVLGTFPAASPAGTKIVARIQPGALLERYAQLAYVVAGGNLTTGSIDAHISHDADLYRAYADNSVIS